MKKYFKTNRQINKINLVEMVSPDKILKSPSFVLHLDIRWTAVVAAVFIESRFYYLGLFQHELTMLIVPNFILYANTTLCVFIAISFLFVNKLVVLYNKIKRRHNLKYLYGTIWPR